MVEDVQTEEAMPYAIYTSLAFTNSSGVEIAGGADVEVRDEADGTLAALFQDRSGSTGLSNPFTADSQGRFEFYVAGGAYRVKVTDSDGNSHTLRYQAIGTAQEFDAGALVQTVASVSDLRAGSYPTSLNRIWLSGYNGVGTAGGGPLYRDSGDTTTADNGGTVFVDADGVRWKRQWENYLSVTWFGAKGDGTTDDSGPINDTIAAVPTEPINTMVFFPRGEYYIGTTTIAPVNAGKRILLSGESTGQGSESTKIFTDDGNTDILDFSTKLTNTFSMQGLQIEGAGVGTGTGRGLVLGKGSTPAFDSRIHNNWFTGIPTAAIDCLDVQGYHIYENGFEGSLFGLRFLDDVTTDNQVNSDNIIHNNRFFRLTTAGIRIEKGRRNLIANNKFDRIAYLEGGTNDDTVGAIDIQVNSSTSEPRGTQIVGNNFGGATGPNVNDIIIRGAISGNNGPNLVTITGNTTDQVNRHFVYANEAAGVAVKGNTIIDPASGNPNTSISDGNGDPFDYQGPAVEILGASTGWFLSENTINIQTTDTDKQPTYGLLLGGSTSDIITENNQWDGKTGPVSNGGSNNIIEGHLTINTDTNTVTGTTTETDMSTTTIPRNAHLHYRGVRVKAAGDKSGSAGGKTVRIAIGTQSSILFSDTNDDDWTVSGEAILDGATSQAFMGQSMNGVQSDAAFIPFSVDLSAGDQILKLTAQLADAADSISQKMFDVEMIR